MRKLNFNLNNNLVGKYMSHHETTDNNDISDAERDANSKADTLAMFSLVVVIVGLAIFFASY
jgi:hypothetical protein